MKIGELIKLASKGYPDNALSEFLNPETDEPWTIEEQERNNFDPGDGLATFIVEELVETFDESLDDFQQVMEAIRAIKRAYEEIGGVVNALYEPELALTPVVADVKKEE